MTLRVAVAGASAIVDTRLPENGREATVPATQPKVVTCNADACRSAGFWPTTPAAYATAASRQSSTPTTDEPSPSDIESPTTAAPANDTATPANRRGGNPSLSSQPPSSAMRIGPTFTTRAAVPASTFCSPQLSAKV